MLKKMIHLSIMAFDAPDGIQRRRGQDFDGFDEFDGFDGF